MNTHAPLVTAGTIFGIVAFVHLLRLLYRSEITISGKVLPMWTSVAGFIIPLSLCIWMFMAS